MLLSNSGAGVGTTWTDTAPAQGMLEAAWRVPRDDDLDSLLRVEECARAG